MYTFRRHVQVSKEAEDQRVRMREQEEARSNLFALRTQLGSKGVPFSARGHVSSRGAAARKRLGNTMAGVARTLGAVTSRELAALHPVAAAAAATAAAAAAGGDGGRISKSRSAAVRVKKVDNESARVAVTPVHAIAVTNDSELVGLGASVRVDEAAVQGGTEVEDAEREVSAVALLPSAAARRIQCTWRMHRGSKWQADAAALAVLPSWPPEMESADDAAVDSSVANAAGASSCPTPWNLGVRGNLLQTI